MKTFEERYTAWIDGQLEGPALTAFELELSRRASAGEARADKADAERLRDLLKSSLQAPAMTNTEFFSHQLSDRIAADRTAERRREQPRRERLPLFAWSFGRLAGLGAACLFVAVALYYGLLPGGTHAYRGETVAKADARPTNGMAVAANDPPAPTVPAVATPANQSSPGQIRLAMRSPTPPPVDLAPADDIQKVQVAEQSKDMTTATPLHYAKPDVNVIWINGLDYLPNVPDESGASPAGAGSPNPAPAAATAQP